MKKFSLHHLLLVGVASILLVLIALIISFLPMGAKAKVPEEIHSLYRLEQTYIQQLEQMDKKQQKEAIEQLLDTVVQLPADGILWDGTTENNSLVASLAKEAATQNVGMVLTVASSMEQKDAEKQAKKLHLSGVCVQGVAQGKLVEYASLTEGLLPITLPDETGAELYAQWAQGTERAVIVASTGGQDSTALYQQLKQPPTQVQQGLVQQVELSIGLPQPEQSTTAEVHFAAGTANPDLPLTVNGQDVPIDIRIVGNCHPFGSGRKYNYCHPRRTNSFGGNYTHQAQKRAHGHPKTLSPMALHLWSRAQRGTSDGSFGQFVV